MQLTARNTDAQSLFSLLEAQEAQKIDITAKAVDIRALDGQIVLATGAEPIFSERGMTAVDGTYVASDVFVGHLADRLGVPVRYLRKLAADRPDLFDANVNGWLQGTTDMTPALDGEPLRYADADPRSFLFRGFAGDGETPNTARALLSDRYDIFDNQHVLAAVLAGFQQANAGEIQVAGADVSDKNMYVRFIAPQVAVGAQDLLRGYRSPFAGDPSADPWAQVVRVGDGGWTVDRARAAAQAEGMGFERGSEPLLWAGFEVTNSELGFGSTTITPRAEFQICRNGLKITVDAASKIHLGGRLETGVVSWSQETRRKALELVTAKTADAVGQFLTPAYWETKVAELSEKANRPVKDAEKTIATVAEKFGFTETERKSIFDHFLRGGQITAGGVMNAVTSAAQTVADADKASDMEAAAVKVLDLV